ncbi:MAG: ABC transporter ATP-binding protein [Solirubrobacteraceae bacterium]
MDPGDIGPAIAAHGIVRRFGKTTVLDRVDLEVSAGEIHALLGPNGAGKTTMIRLLCGLVEPHEGELRTVNPVGFVPSGDRTFYMRISPLENLIFFARLNGLRLREARRRAHDALEKVGLSDAAKRPVGRCSHGMQKRLSVARALLIEPRVLLVDEATHDLDPEGAHRIFELVTGLAREGTAVLWTTQRVEEVRNFAGSITFLVGGRVRFTGSPSEFADRAPNRRYVVRVQSTDLARLPTAAALQLAIGANGKVLAGNGPEGSFVLAPSSDTDLGSAMACLIAAGYEVLSCRQERAEIEEAFLALAEDAA